MHTVCLVTLLFLSLSTYTSSAMEGESKKSPEKIQGERTRRVSIGPVITDLERPTKTEADKSTKAGRLLKFNFFKKKEKAAQAKQQNPEEEKSGSQSRRRRISLALESSTALSPDIFSSIAQQPIRKKHEGSYVAEDIPGNEKMLRARQIYGFHTTLLRLVTHPSLDRVDLREDMLTLLQMDKHWVREYAQLTGTRKEGLLNEDQFFEAANLFAIYSSEEIPKKTIKRGQDKEVGDEITKEDESGSEISPRICTANSLSYQIEAICYQISRRLDATDTRFISAEFDEKFKEFFRKFTMLESKKDPCFNDYIAYLSQAQVKDMEIKEAEIKLTESISRIGNYALTTPPTRSKHKTHVKKLINANSDEELRLSEEEAELETKKGKMLTLNPQALAVIEESGNAVLHIDTTAERHMRELEKEVAETIKTCIQNMVTAQTDQERDSIRTKLEKFLTSCIESNPKEIEKQKKNTDSATLALHKVDASTVLLTQFMQNIFEQIVDEQKKNIQIKEDIDAELVLIRRRLEELNRKEQELYNALRDITKASEFYNVYDEERQSLTDSCQGFCLETQQRLIEKGLLILKAYELRSQPFLIEEAQELRQRIISIQQDSINYLPQHCLASNFTILCQKLREIEEVLAKEKSKKKKGKANEIQT